ncbi:MAG: aminotransferase class I/II-fold pyridoxal phosphate-dependent enzyme, partial [Candidatus Competibacteraceae bacterium]|nr:aminotransferase class I/II-fold pyridoxal phosphate-dependent enzyme [Candidatus Competibacteraceae bacterium]
QLRRAFDGMGLSYLPSQGNFLCVHVDRPGGQLFEELLRQGVIVRPIGAYGLPDYVRITVGTQADNARLIQAMQAVLSG